MCLIRFIEGVKKKICYGPVPKVLSPLPPYGKTRFLQTFGFLVKKDKKIDMHIKRCSMVWNICFYIKFVCIFFPFQNILHLFLFLRIKKPILVAARGLTPPPFKDRSVTNIFFEALKYEFLGFYFLFQNVHIISVILNTDRKREIVSFKLNSVY